MAYTKDEIKAVTFVRDAVHSPQDVRHFMDIGRPAYTVTATINGKEVARSNRALKVKEVGRGVYDPALYFPREDVDMSCLEATEKTTHCPLKGDTTYFDLDLNGEHRKDVAWSYTSTIDDAGVIKDLVAFDNTQVQIIEHTAG
ncbi:MAG: DUF427 domain-containing protein [Pseudomonadota bacterium]